MVFYHTSVNIKIMRNIILDYEASEEISPYEYVKSYFEKCPCENIDESKLTWIAKTFLGFQKHDLFLREVANHLSEELSKEEQDYFMIVLHAITFQMQPKDMELLYKSLFNLSKTLLYTFTNFLSNNEVLTFISQVARSFYDAGYTTEKIIGPLFVWQPYISEMSHNYAKYVQKIESRKIKPLTIPIQPTVLTRKGKERTQHASLPTIPITPPNSVHTRVRKMLTKSAIDRRLKNIHEKNQQKANNLLIAAQNNIPITKPEDKKLFYFKEHTQPIHLITKPKKNITMSLGPPVKENITTIKRMNKRIQMTEQQEIDWYCELMSYNSIPTRKCEELYEYEREEKERERLYDIEKKHLSGLISYEEAVLAKKKVAEQNKKKREQLLKEKEVWNRELEKWKKLQLEACRQHVEKYAFIELNIKEAKNNLTAKNKELAERVKQETEGLIKKAMKLKQEELEHRIKMIKEIKVLSVIAKKARVPKIIDLTETAGLGLMSEMSMAEMQERLAAMKMCIKEELERKKSQVKERNDAAKKDLENVKTCVQNYLNERAYIRKQVKTNKKPVILDKASSKEINDLKKILNEKREMRTKSNS